MVYFIWTWIQNPTVVMNRFQMNAIWLVRRHARTLARNPPKIQPMDPVLVFSDKGEVIYCKIVQERPYKVSLWIRCSINLEHRECRIIQNNGSIKSNLRGDKIYKKIHLFLIMFFCSFFSVSVNILTTAVLHFLTCTWRNKKLGRALSIQVEPWQDLNIRAH